MDAGECLNAIWDWWNQEEMIQLKGYTEMVYPDNLTIDLSEDEFERYDRSSWMTLFLIGHLHTVGRTRLQQHRGFIELLVREGWWDCFTAANPEKRAEDWMNVLERYISQQHDEQTYEQWIMRFPVIYKISRYLDEYRELLLGLEKHKEGFALEQRLVPRADPEQQGGGIDAPMISKTLGIGVNFIIRELIRQRLINTQGVQQHAFVTTEKTRDLLTALGCYDLDRSLSDSPKIHEFLVEHLGEERATFGGCFDIPLRIVAESEPLQRELFNGEIVPSEYNWQ
jgi:hypothetical protein